MKIIPLERGKVKTTELIKMSMDLQIPILVNNHERVDRALNEVMRMVDHNELLGIQVVAGTVTPDPIIIPNFIKSES